MSANEDNKVTAWLQAMPLEMRSGIVRQMTSWLETIPPDMRSKPIFASADEDSETLSPEEILDHVRRGSDYGLQLLKQAIVNTAVDHLAANPVVAVAANVRRFSK